MRIHSLKAALLLAVSLLNFAPAQAQVTTIGTPVVTVPTVPTTPTIPPEIPPEARACPLPRRLHEKPKTPQNWRGLYQDRVVVKLVDDTAVAPLWTAAGPAFRALNSSVSASDVAALNAALAGSKRAMARQNGSVPVTTLAKWRDDAEERSCERMPDLAQYYRVYLAKGEDPMQLVNALNALKLVEVAYLPPIPKNADISPATPDFEGRQNYLESSANGGIGATDAWKIRGARGAGMRVVDVELTWNVNHEDLPPPFWFSGIPTVNEIATALNTTIFDQEIDSHHGTAVAGELVAKDDGHGVTGIVSDAQWGAASVIRVLPALFNDNFGYGLQSGVQDAIASDAILEAVGHVRRGDVILIEQHAPGPDSGAACPTNCEQHEYVAMEYFPDCFDAIRTTTALGIVVVEAAGNGTVSLDAARYDDRFDRTFRDSGAILVGGTSGSTSGVRPNSSSNSGSRVDVSGWGANVMTTGYGAFDWDGPNDPNQFYTAAFNGTSSASPSCRVRCSRFRV